MHNPTFWRSFSDLEMSLICVPNIASKGVFARFKQSAFDPRPRFVLMISQAGPPLSAAGTHMAPRAGASTGATTGLKCAARLPTDALAIARGKHNDNHLGSADKGRKTL